MFIILLILLKFVFGLSLLAIGTVLFRYRYELRPAVCRCKTKLDGKTALVTGGNTGIGYETAKALAKRGARVIIADFKNAEDAVAEIKRYSGNKNVEYRELDLNSFDSVIQFTEDLNKTVDHLDILVNNASIAYSDGRPSVDGNNKILQVNYMAPFLLTSLLLDKIMASKPSRIVITTSGTYELAKLKPDIFYKINERNIISYANSKLCDILWAKALAKRLPQGVTANSVQPGIVNTNIYRTIRYRWLRMLVYFMLGLFFKSPEQGAQTIIHLCCVDELENSTGKYYVDCRMNNLVNEDGLNDLVEKLWYKTVEALRNYYQCRGEEFQPCKSLAF